MKIRDVKNLTVFVAMTAVHAGATVYDPPGSTTEPVISTSASTSVTVGDISGGTVIPNLILQTNGAERARIDGSGNMGIGKAPVSTRKLIVGGFLEVSGTSIGMVFTNGYTPTGTTTPTTKTWDISGRQNNLDINETGARTVMTFIPGGNVGIGTTTTGYKLEVNGSFKAGSAAVTGTVTAGGPISINYQSDQIQLQSYNVAGKTWRMGTYIGATGATRDFTVWESDLGNALTIMQASGSVGIGTVIPKAKLEVVGAQGLRITDGYAANQRNGILSLIGDSEGGKIATGKGQGGTRDLRFVDRDFYKADAETELVRIKNDGRVGIGTGQSVEATLDVAGTSLVKNRDAARYTTFRIQGPGFANGLEMDFFGGSAYDNAGSSYGAGLGGGAIVNVNNSPLVLGTSNTSRIHIAGNGNVGIGKVPTTKLDVAGDANISGTLTVATVNTHVWGINPPDYVFEKDYKMSSLEQVDSYVQKNKHLPDVPSAKEIKEKGMNLAEMNFVLLKKVEELTLHAIRQEKELKRQAEEIKSLKSNQAR